MPILVPASQQGTGWRTPGTPLQPRTAQLGNVVFGTVDQFGTALYLPTITGWDGAIGTTGEATQREGADGAWLSRANRPARLLTLSLRMAGASWESVEKSLDALVAAIPVTEPAPLTIAVGNGVPKQAMVRLSEDVLTDQKGASATLSIPLVAPDPLRYSVVQSHVSMSLPSTVGGLAVPFTVPFSIDATTASGQRILTNAGNAAMFPVWRITGPVTSPVLTNATTGQRWSYLDTIEAGHYLDIDFGRRTALLDGQAPRLGRTDGEWWPLLPGDNTVQFGSSVGSIDARAEIWWRSAWL